MSAKTILYVEDNEVNRKIVQDLLQAAPPTGCSRRLTARPVWRWPGRSVPI